MLRAGNAGARRTELTGQFFRVRLVTRLFTGLAKNAIEHCRGPDKGRRASLQRRPLPRFKAIGWIAAHTGEDHRHLVLFFAQHMHAETACLDDLVMREP